MPFLVWLCSLLLLTAAVISSSGGEQPQTLYQFSSSLGHLRRRSDSWESGEWRVPDEASDDEFQFDSRAYLGQHQPSDRLQRQDERLTQILGASSSRPRPPVNFRRPESSRRRPPTFNRQESSTRSHNRMPPNSNGIPAFQEDYGSIFQLEWGPYPFDKEQFQLQMYPLHLDELRHLYTDTETQPYRIDLPKDSQYTLQVRPASFRPDPEILYEIQSKIWRPQLDRGISGKAIDPDNNKFFREGMYLLPPLENNNGVVQMPQGVMRSRIFHIPGARFRNPSATQAIYHFDVPTTGGPRRILMVTADAKKWVKNFPEDSTSQLWAFYEGRQILPTITSVQGKAVRKQDWGKKGLSFLGAMFLPKSAAKGLLEDKVVEDFIPEKLKRLRVSMR